jgi:hypothetical protein
VKIDFTDSPLRCPRDGKRMVMELGENEAETDAGHVAYHQCLHCGHTEIETGRTMPLASTTGPILAHLRDRIRDDDMTKPLEFEWPVKS